MKPFSSVSIVCKLYAQKPILKNRIEKLLYCNSEHTPVTAHQNKISGM